MILTFKRKCVARFQNSRMFIFNHIQAKLYVNSNVSFDRCFKRHRDSPVTQLILLVQCYCFV